MKKVFLDIECYSNYFLICFKSEKTTRSYEMFSFSDGNNMKLNIDEIKKIMGTYTTVGFNSLNYDLPMLTYALKGASNLQLKQLSDELVNSKEKSWVICKKYNIYITKVWDHIDLTEPAPSVKTGLKMYGARMHTKILQDLPIHHDAILTTEDISKLKEYCVNDIDVTMSLYTKLEKSIVLREKLSVTGVVDYRSKSDAQIAESFFRLAMGAGSVTPDIIDISDTFRYTPPAYIHFTNPDLLLLKQQLVDSSFKLNKAGKPIVSKEVKRKLKINNTTYTVGMGGLHSTEKKRSVVKKDNEFLIDVDVVSYYPSLILTNSYYPEKLGVKFLQHYLGLYNERLRAKANNDLLVSAKNKMLLNSAFGKYASIYSCLYSPSRFAHITLTGQLSLLMLIEFVEETGCNVISANTDGLTIKGDVCYLDKLNLELIRWQNITNLTLERVSYKSIHHESVNSYIAITDDNSVKAKGTYADSGISKSPPIQVCVRAVVNYIKYGKSIDSTILDKNNKITDFILMRNVNDGGAVFTGEYLGKVVRWYYSKDGSEIRYLKNNNLVNTASNCTPIMVIENDTIPNNLDYDKYISIANNMLNNLGITNAN